MAGDVKKKISEKYCPRFGQVAVASGFISGGQLEQALTLQVQDELQGRKHRLLGQILFDQEWMSAAQIDEVLTRLLKRMREEES